MDPTPYPVKIDDRNVYPAEIKMALDDDRIRPLEAEYLSLFLRGGNFGDAENDLAEARRILNRVRQTSSRY